MPSSASDSQASDAHVPDAPASARTFLFLQGPASPLFQVLGQALAGRGHGVRRINLCLGDRVFWKLPGAYDYRGGFDAWGQAVADYMRAERVTDLLLFGDCRPYHRVAIDAARALGARVHVFEDGYLRPNWLTLEEDGVNGHSPLLRDAAGLLARAAALPESRPAQAVRHDFSARMRWDIAYTAAMLAGRAYYPGFVRHRPLHPLLEYAYWIGKLARQRGNDARARKAIASLRASRKPYWLFPLQLDSDYQIRVHSPFTSMAEALETVLGSFARAAPGDALMVVKVHPLDSGAARLRERTAEIARRHGVAGRVVYIDGGSLARLIDASRGVVLVNSTTGLAVLEAGRPLKALGEAIYRVPGLCHEGELDDFWREGRPPDPALRDALRKVVEYTTQVNGGCYSASGIAIAVPLLVARLCDA